MRQTIILAIVLTGALFGVGRAQAKCSLFVGGQFAPDSSPAEAPAPAAPPSGAPQTKASKLGQEVDRLATDARAEIAASGSNDEAGVSSQADDEIATRLGQIRGAYTVARALFGGEHVLLTPGIYFNRRCGTGNRWACTGGPAPTALQSRAGAAAFIALPLFGWGGEHRIGRGWRRALPDFWPVLQTEQATAVYATFTRQLNQYQVIINNRVPVRWQSASLSSKTTAIDQVSQFREAIHQAIASQIDHDGPWRDQAERFDACLVELDTMGLPADTELAILNQVWDEYRGLTGGSVPERHNILLGPVGGIPLSEDPRKIFFYGLALELGSTDFHVTLTGGLSSDYLDDPHLVTGWFGSLALSGELGDDLLHFIAGSAGVKTGVSQR